MSYHETNDDDQEAVARSAQQPIFSTKNLHSSSSPDDAIIIDNDPFSSLTLLDPSHAISQSSKEAGRIAGRTASFNEGQSIGRTKGWEVGLELGYMSNFCKEILNGLKTTQQQQQQRLGMQQQQNDGQSANNIDNDDNDDESTSDGRENMQQSTQKSSSSIRMNSRLDRCTTLARDIVTLIQDFPPPEQLLYPQEDDNNDGDIVADESHQQLDPTTNAKASAALDISTSIQRIRAKFKLLCVLLKTSQSFDLKQILELKRNDDKNDNDGVVAHDGNVKSEKFHQDNDDDVVGVVRSRNKKYDIDHKSNGGSDW